MKGKAMKMTKNASGRLAVATLLSFGLSAGIMGVASASSNRHHDGHDSSWTLGGSVQGVVTGYVAGSSIAIEAQGSTTSTTYALTSATTVTGLATGASLLNSKVVLLLSTTTPVTVLSIKVETNDSKCHGDNDQSKHDDGHSSSHGFSSHGHHGGHSSSQGNFRK
jgi:hypothetical protein